MHIGNVFGLQEEEDVDQIMKEIFGDDDCEEIEDERRGNAENDDNSVWNDVQYVIFFI